MAYKVAIDANAGGTNNGVSANNLNEKDFSLLVSEYIGNRLTDLGIENFLVRDSDSFLSDEERVNIIKNKYGNGDESLEMLYKEGINMDEIRNAANIVQGSLTQEVMNNYYL